jgi:hypothetical protein
MKRSRTAASSHHNMSPELIASVFNTRLFIKEYPQTSIIPYEVELGNNSFTAFEEGVWEVTISNIPVSRWSTNQVMKFIESVPYPSDATCFVRAHLLGYIHESDIYVHVYNDLFETVAHKGVFQVQFTLLPENKHPYTPETLCHILEEGQKPTCVYLQYQGHSCPFLLKYDRPQKYTFELPWNPLCFTFEVEEEKSESHLDYLLLSRKGCIDVGIPSFGTWLLGVVDKINLWFDIVRSHVDNASSFALADGFSYDADCLYGKSHHGIGYYISRGWLVENQKEDNLATLIYNTNKMIEQNNTFWNEIVKGGERRRNSPQGELQCDRSTGEVRNTLVKLYHIGIKTYIPFNPLAPAFLYVEELDPRHVKKIEKSKY